MSYLRTPKTFKNKLFIDIVYMINFFGIYASLYLFDYTKNLYLTINPFLGLSIITVLFIWLITRPKVSMDDKGVTYAATLFSRKFLAWCEVSYIDGNVSSYTRNPTISFYKKNSQYSCAKLSSHFMTLSAKSISNFEGLVQATRANVTVDKTCGDIVGSYKIEQRYQHKNKIMLGCIIGLTVFWLITFAQRRYIHLNIYEPQLIKLLLLIAVIAIIALIYTLASKKVHSYFDREMMNLIMGYGLIIPVVMVATVWSGFCLYNETLIKRPILQKHTMTMQLKDKNDINKLQQWQIKEAGRFYDRSFSIRHWWGMNPSLQQDRFYEVPYQNGRLGSVILTDVSFKNATSVKSPASVR